MLIAQHKDPANVMSTTSGEANPAYGIMTSDAHATAFLVYGAYPPRHVQAASLLMASLSSLAPHNRLDPVQRSGSSMRQAVSQARMRTALGRCRGGRWRKG